VVAADGASKAQVNIDIRIYSAAHFNFEKTPAAIKFVVYGFKLYINNRK
jgi:hypothetical protein